MRLLCYDTETTGTDPATARVVELGACVLEWRGGDWRRVDARRQLIDPGCPIPPDAARVHGITDARVQGKPTLAQVAPRFGAWVEQHSPALVCGYNVTGYDWPLLQAELARAGLAMPAGVQLLERALDPLITLRWEHRAWPRRTLSAACERLGVPLGRAHSALADAEAAGLLWIALRVRGDVPSDPEAALQQQAELVQLLEREHARFGFWLYECRRTKALRLGCGKDRQGRPLCGRPLTEVDPGWCAWVVREVRELPAEVREIFASIGRCAA